MEPLFILALEVTSAFFTDIYCGSRKTELAHMIVSAFGQVTSSFKLLNKLSDFIVIVLRMFKKVQVFI